MQLINENVQHVSIDQLFIDALTILFIALKLCGVITWSWVWVLSPLWISLVLALLIALGVALAVFIGSKR